MGKYFTWRCLRLHLTVLVLVPAFLLAGWWQYTVAIGGNALSWVYTVEWPFFAVYALYIWWKLIHDQSTLFDRLWAARQRAARDADGRPLHEIPGWALDKELSREVYRTSLEAARHPALGSARRPALEAPVRWEGGLLPATPALEARGAPAAPAAQQPAARGPVIDAEVLGVRAEVDEELDAYNRYLFELSRKAPPKQWGLGRLGGRRWWRPEKATEQEPGRGLSAGPR